MNTSQKSKYRDIPKYYIYGEKFSNQSNINEFFTNLFNGGNVKKLNQFENWDQEKITANLEEGRSDVTQSKYSQMVYHLVEKAY